MVYHVIPGIIEHLNGQSHNNYNCFDRNITNIVNTLQSISKNEIYGPEAYDKP